MITTTSGPRAQCAPNGLHLLARGNAESTIYLVIGPAFDRRHMLDVGVRVA